MTKAPVYFTLAQVRFNAITALDSYIAPVQDQFRRAGFPDYQKAMLTTFNFNPGAGGDSGSPQIPVPQMPVIQVARYVFLNMGRTSGFILDQGSLSFHTTDYTVFEEFSRTLVTGLTFLHDVVGLGYTDRIGMRYLDAVYPKDDENLSIYLHASVMGLHEKLDGQLVHAFSETLVKNGPVNTVARVILQTGPIGIPPDLQPMMLEVADRFRGLDGPHAILDTDASYEHRDPFDIDQLQQRLVTVHAAATKAFKATVKQSALDAWK